jgi:hypothetical protein
VTTVALGMDSAAVDVIQQGRRRPARVRHPRPDR